MMKNNRLIWIITAASFITSAVGINFLPDTVPVHFGIDGNPDRFGSKYEMFMIPLVMLLLAASFQFFIYKLNKRADNTDSEKTTQETRTNIKVSRISALMVQITFFFTNLFMMFNAFEDNYIKKDIGFDMFSMLTLIMGIMFIVVENVMPKTKLNGGIGLRTMWSMENDKTWLASNRFGGKAMVISGIISVILGFAVKGVASTIIMTVLLLIATTVSVIYSYHAYNKYKE